MSKAPIPIIGKSYEFYDDGKITTDRRSTATVLEVLSSEKAKSVMFPIYAYDK